MSGGYSFMRNRWVILLSSVATSGMIVGFIKQVSSMLVVHHSGLMTIFFASNRDYRSGKKFDNPIRADGKVVIVTGANTGIGKETAKDLADRGAHVYMACRNLTQCEAVRDEIVLESKNKNVFCRECDLSSFQSIRNFVKT